MPMNLGHDQGSAGTWGTQEYGDTSGARSGHVNRSPISVSTRNRAGHAHASVVHSLRHENVTAARPTTTHTAGSHARPGTSTSAGSGAPAPA